MTIIQICACEIFSVYFGAIFDKKFNLVIICIAYRKMQELELTTSIRSKTISITTKKGMRNNGILNFNFRFKINVGVYRVLDSFNATISNTPYQCRASRVLSVIFVKIIGQ